MGCDMVQGYYFSKPVPPQEFDRFLIERADAEVAAMPEARKTYMSISKALTSDFESIYYVDLVTDYYLEFYTGKDGNLEIRPGGIDFFNDAKDKLLANVSGDDLSKVSDTIGKASLIDMAGQEETASISFCMMRNGVKTPYTLQTIRTRESDKDHIVIGVKQD
jgi:hypothetical protein